MVNADSVYMEQIWRAFDWGKGYKSSARFNILLRNRDTNFLIRNPQVSISPVWK